MWRFNVNFQVTCLLLQSSTTTLSGFTARTTRSTSRAESWEIWVVPTNQMASGSTNSVLQAGTGPNRLLSMKNKVPFSAKSSNSGWVLAIVAFEWSEISDLKLKSGGGGLMETLKGFRGLGVRKTGLVWKIGKVDRMVSMDDLRQLCAVCSEFYSFR